MFTGPNKISLSFIAGILMVCAVTVIALFWKEIAGFFRRKN